MPYKVITPEGVAVSILKKVGDWKDPQGNIIQEDHESVPHLGGDILSDDDVAPSVVALYDANDSHVRSYLVRVDAKGKPVDDVPEEVLQEKPVGEDGPKIVSKDGSGAVKTAPKTAAKATPKAES